MAAMAYRGSAAPQTDFQKKAAPLAEDLITALENEHIREVEVLYRDQLMYRAELQRVIGVMQQDMIPREKQLHDLLDKVNSSYAAATKDLHDKMSSQVGNVQSKKGQKPNADPLADMENELRRITSLLQKPMADQRDLSPEQKRQVEQQVKAQSPARAPPARTGQRVFLCQQEEVPVSLPSQMSSQLPPGYLVVAKGMACATPASPNQRKYPQMDRQMPVATLTPQEAPALEQTRELLG